MRVFVFTIGYHEDHAVRLLTSSGASHDDAVVVLTASPITAGNRRAIEGLRAFTSRVGINDVRVVEVEPTLNGLLRIIEVFHDPRSEYVLSLSGGMRYLIVFTVLALLLTGRLARIHVYPEGGEGTEVVIDKYVLSSIIKKPTKTELSILRIVGRNPGVTDEVIADLIGNRPKTVRNVVSELSKKGLVIRKGRRGGIYLTNWGRVVVRAAEILTSSTS